jgi:hypothetical protein
MVRLIYCLGLWLTLGLVVALGYALGDECGSTSTCIVDPFEAQSNAQSTHSLNENFRGTETTARNTGCVRNPISSVYNLPQSTNVAGANPVFAPSVILTLADNPWRISVCPRAIPTWR